MILEMEAAGADTTGGMVTCVHISILRMGYDTGRRFRWSPVLPQPQHEVPP